jgi:hypothetical protein
MRSSSFPSPWKPTRLFSNIHHSALSSERGCENENEHCALPPARNSLCARINQSSRFFREARRRMDEITPTTSRASLAFCPRSSPETEAACRAKNTPRYCSGGAHLFAKTMQRAALETLFSNSRTLQTCALETYSRKMSIL